MPVLNRFELCKKIIELDKTVYIIFVTTSEQFYENIRKKSYPERIINNVNIFKSQLQMRS
jgi:hypothetical protein